MKSFSSFSFSDVALDYKDYKVVPRLVMAQDSSSRRQARAGFWSKSRSVDLWLREHFAGPSAGEDTAGPAREKLAGDTQISVTITI